MTSFAAVVYKINSLERNLLFLNNLFSLLHSSAFPVSKFQTVENIICFHICKRVFHFEEFCSVFA